jgi:hypothetical protein
MTVSVASSVLRMNFTWLPFWLYSTNFADSSRRFTSRNDSGLSRANLDLDRLNLWRSGRLWSFKVKFEGFFQVREGFFFASALTGDIHFEALGDEPVCFAPSGGGKWFFHVSILT